MKKNIKLTENQLTNLIEKILKESEVEFDDTIGAEFSVEPHVRKQPREKQIEKMFGKYEEQIPNDIIRYMRKNPQLMMDRLARIYGEKFLDYAEKSYVKYMDKKYN